MTSTATKSKPLKAPFPYPGGKSKVADLVWSRFGNVDNYVEPFAGSLAMLLRRPADHFEGGYRVETINDANHFIVNFWRAVKADPDAVAYHADGPVMEADLHARHKWLVRSESAAAWRERMRVDPEAYDAKIAGWWVWGQCCWIRSGWCSDNSAVATPDCNGRKSLKKGGEGGIHSGRPQLADAYDLGRGVHSGGGLHDKRPQFPDGGIGRGVNGLSQKVPELAGGRGHDAAPAGLSQQVPILSNGVGQGVTAGPMMPQAGLCDARLSWLRDWMRRLSDRFRHVRTLYGHWSRPCDSPSTLTSLGVTGVFLDPPYPANREDDGKKSRDANLYATDKGADLDALRDEVRDWCVKWGGEPAIRIAVCGYEGDGYEVLADAHGWTCESWTASGGYGNQRKDKKGKADNAKRERIWFSAGCTPPAPTLFDTVQA